MKAQAVGWWRDGEVTVYGLNVAHVHFEPPPGERIRGFKIKPDYLLIESVLVNNEEQVAPGAPPMPAKVLNGAVIDMPRGRTTVRLRNPEKLPAFATVRALP